MKKIAVSKKSTLSYSIGSLLLLLGLCGLVANQNGLLNSFDNSVTQIIQSIFGFHKMNYQGSFFNDLMTFLATYGDATPLIFLTIVISIILFIRHYQLLSLWFLGVVATGGIIGVLMKFNLHRSRPVGHLPVDDGFSFPSGHAVGSTLVFLVIIMIIIPLISNNLAKASLQILASLVWIGILFSRLYFSAHHFSDLVGGILLGIFWVFVAKFIYDSCAVWLQKIFSKKSIV